MQEEKHLPKISAKTAEEFAEIQQRLKKLPYCIVAQMESAQYGSVGIECVINTRYEKQPKVVLPDSVSQITDFEDYIGIYCGEFFFKIEKKETLKTVDYIILNADQMEFYLKQDKGE